MRPTELSASRFDPPRIRVTLTQAMRIVLPYSWHQIREQLLIVAPVCLYLAVIQLVVLRYGLARVGWIVGGVTLVILGLAFFLEGVRVGLVPLGERIGDTLPARSTLTTVLVFAFLLGNLAAFGEPVIGSLQIAGAGVDAMKAPLLYTILVGRPGLLSLAISLGVGVAVVIGTLRFIYGWSLKPIVLPLIALAMVLTVATSVNDELATAIGLAWDAGAVIVGPVLCPLVLSLGLGVCRATGRSDAGLAGFGMVGLVSIVPVVVVIVLAVALWITSPPVIPYAAVVSTGRPPLATLAIESLTLGVRAIAPIFVFLYAFLRFVLKEEPITRAQLVLGLAFAAFGLFLFNFGLAVGIDELGHQVGQRLPATFGAEGRALYPSAIGKAIVVLFGALLGYGATLAEPAFNVLGRQVEDVTQGAFKKWLFSQAVALGVGIGAGLGMMSLVYEINLLVLLLPPYALLFILTLVSEEQYVTIAWDGGAVTTGPVTVPLKIAIGVALSHATGFAEGFGILALASAYPVLNILLLGLYVKRRLALEPGGA